MSVAWSSQRTTGDGGGTASADPAQVPGKRTLTEDLPLIPPVQRVAAAGSPAGGADVHAAAAHGTSEAGTSLPHLDWIQRTFGRHDVGHVRAHVGGVAAEGAAAMGAEAFATGSHVAFARQPDLHTAAHEAAHVVQQRGGVQLKGGVGEAGDPHEQHADAVADRVVQGKSTEDLLDQVSGEVSGGGGPATSGAGSVQRKITIEPATPAAGSSTGPAPTEAAPPAKASKGKKAAAARPSTSAADVPAVQEVTEEDVMEFLEKHGKLSRAAEIYQAVLATKPRGVTDRDEVKTFDAEANAPRLVKDWVGFQLADAKPYPYRDTDEGAAKLLKDAFKYWLHTEHGWNSVGVAEYMTGDATGLALAPIADENMTVKVLTGPQKTEPAPDGGRRVTKQGETFLNKPSSEAGASEDPADRLPEAFATAKDQGSIRFSDAAARDDSKYSGTDELYRRRYNVHDKEDPVKPWNKETHAATSAIGKGLEDPTTAEKLRKPLQLGDTPEGEAARAQVRAYKKKLDLTIGGKPCLILWGRTSGRDKPGGAHKELDSHALMIQQLTEELRSKFQDRALVFVGDDALTREEFQGTRLPNELFYVGKFWNDQEYGPALRGREQQRYLFELFSQENDAISLGMRSGSLEGLALLGMRVIFIDDLGNNAAGRMESWAGSAANGRAEAYAGADADTRVAHETKHAGPLKNYKRVGTLLQMGNQVDIRRATLTKIREAIRPLTGVDALGKPICNETGNPQANQLLANILGKLAALEAVGREVGAGGGAVPGADAPDDAPAMDAQREAEAKQAADRRRAVDAAYADLAKVPDQLQPTKINYTGTPEMVGYRFNSDQLTAAIDKLEPLAKADSKAREASDKLRQLETDTDALDERLVHSGDTSKPAAGLLAMVDKAPKGLPGFLAAFDGQRTRMLGAATGGVKFRTADVERLKAALDRLEANNVLQPSELDQVSTLVTQMSGPPPAHAAESHDGQPAALDSDGRAASGATQPGRYAPGEWLDIRTSLLHS